MWQSLSLIWIAVAVSVDSFGVGITYGLRKIRIPVISCLIIGICSGFIMFLAMKLGEWLSVWFFPELAKMIGAVILIAMGTWTLCHRCFPEAEKNQAPLNQAPIRVWTFRLQTLGLMIQILKTPVVADMDDSGVISAKEACLLGTALSLDAFGAGIGAALMGISPIVISLAIAAMSILFLRWGMWLAFRCCREQWHRLLSFVPGIILIFIGLLRLL
ncbi:sporulation membrane protein YtaF [Thermoflavimicrobium daqui]|jgi:putative sporulation protein YtaF|uniref:Sporulation membrane protein YtaF n=1 Tax=Thermoflavimicrobium daqui TaxID=2137476 RepID=A0A364K9C3_9BACL|nr:sporulation membrane protein YtaF [Thermoflavimicrobium daqui]RAL26822.1 sporulation membrane protein YtaF [Thermoflavimicrobium daqui]